MIREIDARIRRALGGVRLAFRGVITLVKAAGAVQLVQLDGMSGEQLQDTELFQHYGFTSNPPVGTMAIVLPLGGKTAHGIIIATEHGSYRLKNLAGGETAIYSDEGDHVHLKRGRVMEIVTQTLLIKATTKVRMETPLVETTGKIEADDTIRDLRPTNNRTVDGMRQQYNAHTHPDAQGGNTGTPSQGM